MTAGHNNNLFAEGLESSSEQFLGKGLQTRMAVSARPICLSPPKDRPCLRHSMRTCRRTHIAIGCCGAWAWCEFCRRGGGWIP